MSDTDPPTTESVERLLEATTPGPWRWVDPITDIPTLPDSDHYNLSLRSVKDTRTTQWGTTLPNFIINSAEFEEERREADARLIAAAPTLAAEVVRLQARLEPLRLLALELTKELVMTCEDPQHAEQVEMLGGKTDELSSD